MAHYAIGDLQGCFDELDTLLNTIAFNHGTDTLWLVGDIVNRGNKSLECLEFCMKHESSVQIVLGNHDLHLLAILYGKSKTKRQDTLDDIIHHRHASKMRDWLRQQAMMRQNEQYVLVHAGLHPDWTVAQASDLAREIETELSGKHAERFLEKMYGNEPNQWSESLKSTERLRFATNVMTRMRVLQAQNQLDFDFKSVYDDIPESLYAWFDAPNRQHLSHTIVFGHWSALGFRHEKQVIALDTGALWGGHLSAINLDNHQVTQVASLNGIPKK